MAKPSGESEKAIEVHRLKRDITNAVYAISFIFFLPLALLLGLRLFDPSMRNSSLGGILAILTLWGVGTALALIRARMARFEILRDGFRYKSLFRDSRFRYEDIAGFRAEVGRYGGRSAEALGILYDIAGRRVLRISAYWERPKSIRDWMRARFRDLDAAETADERMLLSRLGESHPETVPRLRAAAIALDTASIALAILWIVSFRFGGFGRLQEIFGFLVFAIPLLALGLRAHFGRLVSLERTVYRSRLARIEAALILPPITGWGIAFIVPPVRSRAAWALALAICLFFFFGTLRYAPLRLSNRFMALIALLLALGYAYGLVCFLNATFDFGEVERRTVVVQSRSVRRGVATVVVSPPSSPDETHSLEVPLFLEEAMPPGNSAVLLVKPGAFGIPWVAGVIPTR
jgi:hypothetical protein